jgi:uncharacterized membrane protein YdjX (TVP38/TMEM64 family)
VTDTLLAAVQSWQSLGLAGLGGLSLVFALGAVVYIPRFTLYLLGGLVFGLAAAPAAVIGTTAGAVIAFLLARYALRERVARRIEARPALQTVVDAINAEGWRLVALFRIASPLPGGAINYLFGLTGIRLGPYTAATCIGLIPPVLLFVGFGAIGRMTMNELDASRNEAALIAAGLVVLAVAVLLVMRRMRASITLLRARSAPVRRADPV